MQSSTVAIQVGSDDTDKTVKDFNKGYYEILLISPKSLLTSKDWRDYAAVTGLCIKSS